MASALTFSLTHNPAKTDVQLYDYLMHLTIQSCFVALCNCQLANPCSSATVMSISTKSDAVESCSNSRLNSQCAVWRKAGNVRYCTILCLSRANFSHACPGCSGTLQCVTGAGIGTVGMMLLSRSAAKGLCPSFCSGWAGWCTTSGAVAGNACCCSCCC